MSVFKFIFGTRMKKCLGEGKGYINLKKKPDFVNKLI